MQKVEDEMVKELQEAENSSYYDETESEDDSLVAED